MILVQVLRIVELIVGLQLLDSNVTGTEDFFMIPTYHCRAVEVSVEKVYGRLSVIFSVWAVKAPRGEAPTNCVIRIGGKPEPLQGSYNFENARDLKQV